MSITLLSTALAASLFVVATSTSPDPANVSTVPFVRSARVPVLATARATAPAATPAAAPAAAPTSRPIARGQEALAPPGLVFLKKERVVIGLNGDAAKETIVATGGANISIWGETPAHKEQVDDFFLMATEVTNEQFAEYILAAGSQPSALWAKPAIDKARQAFLIEKGKEREEAREAGKEVPPRELFDSDTWWKLNWETTEWKVPTELASLPVIEINYSQAESYARWAGLRMMTEEEFQRAVRGKTENLYPWGSNWDHTKAVTAEDARDRLAPVGSRPDGASVDGIHDLPGGVWEWTSSKYLPYPKHKSQTLTTGKGASKKITNLSVEWDEAQRVSVGGCYKNEGTAARATTRRPTFTDETTNALGFRCAASPQIGFDIANIVERKDVGRAIRSDHKFDMTLTVAMDRWGSRKGEAGKRLDNYAVITDYEYVLFTPLAELNSSNPSVLGKKTISDGPLILGFISTTVALTNPKLEPGTYMLGWRAAGKNRGADPAPDNPQAKRGRSQEDDGEPLKKPLEGSGIEFNDKVENLVFMDKDGNPLAAVPFKGIASERLRAGAITVSEVPEDKRKEIAAYDQILISAVVPAGRRGFLFDITLQCAKGATKGGWRK